LSLRNRSQGILADKDERIYSLQEQLVQMREQLVAANMDTEKSSVSMLTKVPISLRCLPTLFML
jgi:hypothetical protein